MHLYVCIYTVSDLFFLNIRNSGTCMSSASRSKNFDPGTNPYLFYPIVQGWKACNLPIVCSPLATFPSGLIQLCLGWLLHTWVMQRQPKRDGWDALRTSVFLTLFFSRCHIYPATWLKMNSPSVHLHFPISVFGGKRERETVIAGKEK